MIKKHIALVRIGMLDVLQYRGDAIMGFFSNLIYFFITFGLWTAIYASSPNDVVNGMTFKNTVIYISVSMVVFNLLNSFLVWQFHRDLQSGKVTLDLLRPINYQVFLFLNYLGGIATWFFITFTPTLIILAVFARGAFSLGMNIVYFLISLVMSIVINFCIDFFVATICLYTESVWGINQAKETVVLLLSGATIPIAFFPETLRNIMMKLPFQAIYNAPLRNLTDLSMTAKDRMEIYLLQLVWIAVMVTVSAAFWKKSVKVITVNGG